MHATWNTKISGSKIFIVVSKLKIVKIALKNLKKKTEFTDVQAVDLCAYQAMIAAQEVMHLTPAVRNLADLELRAIQEYRVKHKIYLNFLSQKAKLAWIKAGDKNINLFHHSIRSRHVQNQVYSIMI